MVDFDKYDTSNDDTVTDVGIHTDAVSTRLEEERSEYLGEGSTDTYSDENGETPDDVDPRKLFRSPSVNEFRWYYREGVYGEPLIDKPINDAFKHGFKIKNDYSNKVEDFLDWYVPYYKKVKKASRLDGFSVLFWQLKDTASVSEEPENVNGISDFRVLRIDDLSDAVSTVEIADKFDGLEPIQINVNKWGIVYIDDFSHPNHEKILGYGVEMSHSNDQVRFVHESRCEHFVNRPEVVGDLESDAIGKLEGESVLASVIHPLKSYSKGIWAMGESLYRYSAPLHVAHTPPEYGEEEYNEVDSQMGKVNMASSITMPPGTELSTTDAASDFDPEPFVEILVQAICAGTEFTKSVLQGTQSGTVSGSSTDIKNYFNGVEEWRRNEAEQELRRSVKRAHRFDRSVIPSFSLGFKFDWEPMFKLDALDRMEGAVRVMTAATNGINNYILSQEEARSIVQETWADVDIDVDLDEITEEDMDQLDRINQGSMPQKNGLSSSENEVEGNPRRGQNGGGMSQEQTTEQNDPTTN